MSKQWKKAIIRVALASEPRDVEVVACGPLAIYKPDGLPRRIVHVPSGLRVCSAFVGYAERRPPLAVLKARAEWSLANQPEIWAALESLPFNASAGVMSGAHKNAIRAMNSNPPRVQKIA